MHVVLLLRTWKGHSRLRHITPLLQPIINNSCKVTSPAAGNAPAASVIAKPRETTPLKNEVSGLATSLNYVPAETINVDPTSPSPTRRKPVVEEKQWQERTTDYSTLAQQYLKLSKFRLTSLVVMTSMAGYAMAPEPFCATTFLLCSVGTGLMSSAANTVNQFFEVPFDSQMSRTKNRVLVRGMLTPMHAVVFAAACGTAGLSTLYWGVNGLTAALGATNLILYTLIYTPMKRISILNTWVGSIVGAVPPLIGWAGCADSLGPGAWILAGILYAWQFPHFNALSWNLRPDYSRAGYRMMAVTNPGLCRRTALRYTGALLALSCLAPVLDVTNWYFAVGAVPLNTYFLYLAWKFYRNSDSASSRKLFRFSLLHLPVLMVMMLVTKKHWESSPSDNSEQNKKPFSIMEKVVKFSS